MFLVIFKNIYMKFKMRPKIKRTNGTKHHKRLAASSKQTASNDFQDSGRREGYIEYPEMSLTPNHNSQVMKKYR